MRDKSGKPSAPTSTSASKTNRPSHLRPVTAGDKPGSVKIDPEDFRMAASDDKGRSITLSFRCPPMWKAIIEELIWSRKFPIKSDGLLLRLALKEYATKLQRLEPNVKVATFLSNTEMMQELVNRADQLLQFSDLVRQLEKVVAQYIEREMRGSAVKLVYEFRKQIQRERDVNLRKHQLSELERKLGHVLRGNGYGGGSSAEVTKAFLAIDEHEETEEDVEHIMASWDFIAPGAGEIEGQHEEAMGLPVVGETVDETTGETAHEGGDAHDGSMVDGDVHPN